MIKVTILDEEGLKNKINAENIYKELVEKIEDEYLRFENETLEKSPKEIYDMGYEISWVTELKEYFLDRIDEGEIDDSEVEYLISQENILSQLYMEWIDLDTSVDDDIHSMLKIFFEKAKAFK